MTTTTTRTCLLLSALLLVATSLRAEHSWSIHFEAGSAQYSRNSFSSYGGISFSELSLDSGYSYFLAAEYRPAPRFGLELSIGSVDLDARWRQVEIRPISFNPLVLGEFTVASDSGTFALRPITLGLLFHPLRPGRFDLYVGPELGRTSFHVGLQGPPSRDPEWTVGGKGGFDVALAGSPWSTGLAYRFLETQHEGLDRDQYTGLGVHLLSAVVSYGKGNRN